MTYAADDEIRQELIAFLESKEVLYFLTLTCLANVNEVKGRQLLNKVHRNLSKKIFKARFSKGLNYIDGFVFEELTPEKNTIHYHMLILASDVCPAEYIGDKDRLDRIIWKIVEKLKHTRYLDMKRNAFHDHDLQEFTKIDGKSLPSYVTKRMEKERYHKSLPDYVGICTSEGITFGGDSEIDVFG